MHKVIDDQGREVTSGQQSTREFMQMALEHGDVVLAVLRLGEDLHVHIYAPPSRELLEILEEATRSVRRAVALQGSGT